MRTTNIRWTLISTLAALSLSAFPALAESGRQSRPAQKDPSAFIKHFDRNGDGKLEVSELPGHLKARLGAADTNQDGVLSAEELSAKWDSARKEHLAKVDTDGDGKISDAERAAFREEKGKEHFAKLDKNGDGQISEAEVPPRLWSHLSAADTDKNGSVSYAEMSQAMSDGTLHMRGHGHHRGHAEPKGDDAKS